MSEAGRLLDKFRQVKANASSIKKGLGTPAIT
jgi:hypothetical protein